MILFKKLYWHPKGIKTQERFIFIQTHKKWWKGIYFEKRYSNVDSKEVLYYKLIIKGIEYAGAKWYCLKKTGLIYLENIGWTCKK